MKSYLLGQTLSERSRGLVGYHQTSSLHQFASMLQRLDLFYDRNRTTAFEEAVRKIGYFNTNNPDCRILEQLIDVLNRATDEVGDTSSKSSIINLDLQVW